MDVVDLLVIGEDELKAEDERKAKAAANKDLALRDGRTKALESVREELGLSPEVFEKFKPTHRYGVWPNVHLHYKNEAIGFVVEKRSRADLEEFIEVRCDGETPIAYLAKKMAQIERDLDKAVRETLRVLDGQIEAWWLNNYTNRRQFMGWNLPEVRLARATYLRRVFDAGIAMSAKSQRNNWLDEIKQLADLPVVAECLPGYEAEIERSNKREHLLYCIEKRRHPESGEQLGIDEAWDEDRGVYSDAVTRYEVEVYRTASVEAGLLDDEQIKTALEAREQQMLDAEMRAAVEMKRIALEADLFRPFSYYTVRYGIVATDDEDERMVSTDSFDALHDAPDELGYWTTVRGKQVKPTFVALVEANEVKTVSELLALSWRHRLRRDSEFGSIYVSPQVAEVTS